MLCTPCQSAGSCQTSVGPRLQRSWPLTSPWVQLPVLLQVNRLLLDLVRVGETHGIRFPREFALLIKQLLYFGEHSAPHRRAWQCICSRRAGKLVLQLTPRHDWIYHRMDGPSHQPGKIEEMPFRCICPSPS